MYRVFLVIRFYIAFDRGFTLKRRFSGAQPILYVVLRVVKRVNSVLNARAWRGRVGRAYGPNSRITLSKSCGGPASRGAFTRAPGPAAAASFQGATALNSGSRRGWGRGSFSERYTTTSGRTAGTECRLSSSTRHLSTAFTSRAVEANRSTLTTGSQRTGNGGGRKYCRSGGP